MEKSSLQIQKRSWEEKKKLCEEWKKSGETKLKFCHENELALASFYSWCAKLWPDQYKARVKNLAPVSIKSKIKPFDDENITVELNLSGQTNLKLKLPYSKLISFIQEITYATSIIR